MADHFVQILLKGGSSFPSLLPFPITLGGQIVLKFALNLYI